MNVTISAPPEFFKALTALVKALGGVKFSESEAVKTEDAPARPGPWFKKSDFMRAYGVSYDTVKQLIECGVVEASDGSGRWMYRRLFDKRSEPEKREVLPIVERRPLERLPKATPVGEWELPRNFRRLHGLTNAGLLRGQFAMLAQGS